MPLRSRQSVLASEHGGRLSADLKVGLGKGKGVAQTKTDPQNNCIQNIGHWCSETPGALDSTAPQGSAAKRQDPLGVLAWAGV